MVRIQRGIADKSFGTDGVAVFETKAEIEAKAVAVQHDGRILVAGDLVNDETGLCGAIIMAFTESGVRDIGFGEDGLIAFVDPAMEIKSGGSCGPGGRQDPFVVKCGRFFDHCGPLHA